MGKAGMVFRMLRTAAGSIPWLSVVENTPALLNLVESARERFSAMASHGLENAMRELQDENLKLAESLLQTQSHLQEVTRTLEVVLARQKTLAVVTVISLVVAVSSLVVAVVK
jgi:hypothetical protein